MKAVKSVDIASTLTAVGVLIPITVAGFLAVWREIKKVHVIVNNHQTKQLEYIGLLIATLHENRIVPPPDPSVATSDQQQPQQL